MQTKRELSPHGPPTSAFPQQTPGAERSPVARLQTRSSSREHSKPHPQASPSVPKVSLRQNPASHPDGPQFLMQEWPFGHIANGRALVRAHPLSPVAKLIKQRGTSSLLSVHCEPPPHEGPLELQGYPIFSSFSATHLPALQKSLLPVKKQGPLPPHCSSSPHTLGPVSSLSQARPSKLTIVTSSSSQPSVRKTQTACEGSEEESNHVTRERRHCRSRTPWGVLNLRQPRIAPLP